jgi:hypothetical protein
MLLALILGVTLEAPIQEALTQEALIQEVLIREVEETLEVGTLEVMAVMGETLETLVTSVAVEA